MSLNNKLAKYGIVLIATITVATAVQAQNITTQYVYAEEVTANDPALNRLLYLDYSSPEDPTLSWLTGDVVTPAGYTVEPAEELEGYPYYTITGSDGKSYSVGDNITVEDPLVNHANPEDNVLYYRYYSVDPNASASETPAPSTSETQSTSTAPATSETPAPSTSETQSTSTAPATSETPAPSTSETQSTSTAPATSETPAVEKPSQKTDDKTTATDKAKDAKVVDKKADSKPAKTEKSKDANSKKAAATKDNSVANKAAEKSNATSAPTEQAKDTTAKANNPNAGNSQSIVKEAAGTVDTAAVNHNDNNGFLATLLVSVAAALIGLFQYKKQPKKEK